jgi:hypothetical protein
MYFYVNDLHARLSVERFEAFISALESVPPLTA